MLSCEIYPDDSFKGFQWVRRGGNTISTASNTTLVNYIVKNQWNTITTYYGLTQNSNGKYTTKTYVNGNLVDTNTACTAITDGATNNVQDHIITNVYGTAGSTFYLDNVKYYMTNVADGLVFSYDGNITSYIGWAAAGTGYGEITDGQAATSGKGQTL